MSSDYLESTETEIKGVLVRRDMEPKGFRAYVFPQMVKVPERETDNEDQNHNLGAQRDLAIVDIEG